MIRSYHALGQVLSGLAPEQLTHAQSRQMLAACHRHPAFSVVELRKISNPSDVSKPAIDGIVVDCCDGTVPSRNLIGIHNKERLLLLHGPGLLTPHEVRALRTGFPATAHQNSIFNGEPTSLCLYFEPWSAVERTWTPEKHLQRILWWLRETSVGTLHRTDQPLERLYFVSPYQIVLPADFNERVARRTEVLHLACARSRDKGTMLRGAFGPRPEKHAARDDFGMDILVVAVPPALSTRIERYPADLCALHDQLVARGSTLLAPLQEAAKQAMSGSGMPMHDPAAQHTLLLLQIPVTRAGSQTPERVDVSGFVIRGAPLSRLGLDTGAFFDGRDGKAYVSNTLSLSRDTTADESPKAWRGLPIEPIDVKVAFSAADVHRASGVDNAAGDFRGILAGVGALGSSMAEIWSREAWGRWTYVDDDILLPHNLVRHIGKDLHIGWAKVDVVAQMGELNWPSSVKPEAVYANATDNENPDVQRAVCEAHLFVDATTTLEVPRDLSDRDDMPRMVSTFITPSGRSGVLLFEDEARSARLACLEAQYYRGLLNSDWGATHLAGHQGSYWVGAGCRDLSGVLAHELVQLHGATLARQVRLLATQPDSQIRVWTVDEESGAVSVNVVTVAPSVERKAGKWRVVWDEELARKVRHLRDQSLPSETGGVLLGYVDQKRNAIHLVDVLPAPIDSDANRTGFTRGATGLPEAIAEAAGRTANIVGYLGEWHSHPQHASATPSAADQTLLAYLADTLSLDGVPALMLIVADRDISITIKEGCTHD
ncbi:integrative and conjugative element protein, VC0181 family [Janthinobacterium sp. OK676]|nr:integrative and conjugative element protein, VC0181 family [Janthinobacterium sp. OK676]